MLIYILFRILSPVAINAALASKALAYILVIFGILLPLARNVLGIPHRPRAPRNANHPSLLAAIGRGIRGLYFFFYKRIPCTTLWAFSLPFRKFISTFTTKVDYFRFCHFFSFLCFIFNMQYLLKKLFLIF